MYLQKHKKYKPLIAITVAIAVFLQAFFSPFIATLSAKAASNGYNIGVTDTGKSIISSSNPSPL
ncbi:hypothetical protein HCJ58_15285, partial [Listeria sp. FSL L7-1509]